MSVKVMTRVWEHSKATGTHRLVMLALADHCDNDGVTWPSHETIAKKVLVGERQVINIIEKLEAAGEIICLHYRGRRRSNRYLVRVGLQDEEVLHLLMTHPQLALKLDKAEIAMKKGAIHFTISQKKGEADCTFSDQEKVKSESEKGEMGRHKKVKSDAVKGEIAISPEPSLIEPSITEPSESEPKKSDLHQTNGSGPPTDEPPKDGQALWADVLEVLEGQFTQGQFDQMLVGTKVLARDGPTLTIGAHSPDHVIRFERQLIKRIDHAAKVATEGAIQHVKFVVNGA